ncbi:MAG: DUF2116 family Zn-ribbon domain-containing protein [Bacteroidetes bacterium]|nr:DUF2116 family Zn-ribbon domain-containing protein [Bacteroidota bacterium]
METNARLCLDCGETIKGRSDKKFCSDQCRNNFNNKQNSENNVLVKNINSLLKKNRKILEDLLPPEGKINTTKSKLIDKGFSFTYHTHTYTTQKGSTYIFCYEYGYLPLEGDWLMIVKRVEA